MFRSSLSVLSTLHHGLWVSDDRYRWSEQADFDDHKQAALISAGKLRRRSSCGSGKDYPTAKTRSFGVAPYLAKSHCAQFVVTIVIRCESTLAMKSS
jgi:hypothetical protein